jgi:hypothetical protein
MRRRTPKPVVAEPATAEGPPRRRSSWNLRTIVEDVAGRPIEELQDPDRPPHPYLKNRPPPTPAPTRTAPEPVNEYDPVNHVYPPFVGAAGRAFHGSGQEHDLETIERHRTPVGLRGAGPSRRPERLYLHYLLLHLDRLSDSALQYLRVALDEEIGRRAPPAPAPPPLVTPEPPSTDPSPPEGPTPETDAAEAARDGPPSPEPRPA